MYLFIEMTFLFLASGVGRDVNTIASFPRTDEPNIRPQKRGEAK
jgi:hypothetical protein